ncbi:LysR family transcriptional regulator [Vibrio sp. HN007]|uniref:LysR family transcriptional regulator n=1 Tax=Vibrio iocasae TaxID=3098914 RepID=UPI0035D4D579
MDKFELMRTFIMVSKEGAFSKAADKLNMSPQLVSKYVSALEDRLQVRLLNRTTRKISLTEAGKRYLNRCEQILLDIEEMEGSLVDWHQKVSGEITINAPMSFGYRHLPKLLMDFCNLYPDVKVKLDLTDRKVNIVEEGVDVALRIGNLESDNIIARKIANVQIALLASPKYLEKNGTPTTPTALSGHQILNFSYGDPSIFKKSLGLNYSELKLNQSISANNGDLLMEIAKLGGGITVQPTFIASDEIRKGDLIRVLPDYQPEVTGLYLIYSNRKHMPSRTRAFIDFCSTYYDKIPYWDE